MLRAFNEFVVETEILRQEKYRSQAEHRAVPSIVQCPRIGSSRPRIKPKIVEQDEGNFGFGAFGSARMATVLEL